MMAPSGHLYCDECGCRIPLTDIHNRKAQLADPSDRYGTDLCVQCLRETAPPFVIGQGTSQTVWPKENPNDPIGT